MGEETEHFAALYDPWAEIYDDHYRATFGRLIDSLTRRTLAVVREAGLEGMSALDAAAARGGFSGWA